MNQTTLFPIEELEPKPLTDAQIKHKHERMVIMAKRAKREARALKAVKKEAREERKIQAKKDAGEDLENREEAMLLYYITRRENRERVWKPSYFHYRERERCKCPSCGGRAERGGKGTF